MWHELRFTLRQLRRSPVFTAVATASLALAIGANSTIFSIVNALVVRPLPVAQPEQLFIAVGQADTGEDFSYPMIKRAAAMLAERGALCGQSRPRTVQLSRTGSSDRSARPETATLQLVTGDCFSVLRQRPGAGRLFGPDDDRVLGGHPVAVISDAFWARAFNRSPAAVGGSLMVNDVPLTIVGVTAREFTGTTVGAPVPDLWAPVMMQAALRFAGNGTNNGGSWDDPYPPQQGIYWLSLLGRTQMPRGDVTSVLNRAQEEERPASVPRTMTRGPIVVVAGSHGFSSFRDRIRPQLFALSGMAALLLALAATNVAGVLLARGIRRYRELAIRLSVGASRWMLMRQRVLESVILALAGGAIGLLLAWRGSRLLLTLMNRDTPVASLDVAPDWPVALLTLAVASLVGLAAGLLGAWRSTRLGAGAALHSGSPIARTEHSVRRLGPGALLMAAQMAFSVVLLVAAALCVRTLQAVTAIDLGMNPDHVIVARIDPRSGGYAAGELRLLYERVTDAAQSVPGVVNVSLSAGGPLGGSISSGTLAVEGYAPRSGERVRGVRERVMGNYVDVVGLRIVQGRPFTVADAVPGHRVSLINETMARHYFGGQPLGRRWGYGSDFNDSGYEVIGVVQDAAYVTDVKAERDNMVYMLAPSDPAAVFLNSLEVRVRGDDAAVIPLLRAALNAREPRLPVRTVEPLRARVAAAAAPERMLAGLSSTFAGIALLLACLGLYGMMSYSVSRRTVEIGVRMALGATSWVVRRRVLGEALAVGVLGGLTGLPMAIAAARLLRTQLYGVAPVDAAAYAAALGILLTVTLAAAYVPARRAARLEPTQALRAE